MKNSPSPYFLFAVLVLGALCGCKQKQPPHSMPLMSIPVTEAIQAEVPYVKTFTGQIYGKSDITIQARAEGYLKEILFEQGSSVRKGQLLYVIDPLILQTAVVEAEASVARVLATLVQARSNYNRLKPLVEINAVSQSNMDDATAQLTSAKAAYASAEAQLHYAQLQLAYTKIYAPINGVIGQTKAKVGDYVGPQTPYSVLNTLSDIGTVNVQFSIPDAEYLWLKEHAATPASSAAATPVISASTTSSVAVQGRSAQTAATAQVAPAVSPGVASTATAQVASANTFLREIRLQLSNGESYPFLGTFDFVNRQVDPTTGTIMAQVSFPNPDFLLRPGQFARVSVTVGSDERAVLVPQQCVVQTQGQANLYVVGRDSVITYRSVTLGNTYGTQWVIATGLREGETVVVEGFYKVRSGMKIRPVPYQKYLEERAAQQAATQAAAQAAEKSPSKASNKSADETLNKTANSPAVKITTKKGADHE